MSFDLADRSPWAKLANATLTFRRITATAINPSTGNDEPSAWEELSGRAYFEEAELVADEGKGVPIGTYRARGYTVGILPNWARTPTDPEIECSVDRLGDGTFYHQGKIPVVADRIEKAGKGTPIQGYFAKGGNQ
jgi:hypothetical protein